MNLPGENIDGFFRISLCKNTKKEELDTFITGVEKILKWKNRSFKT